MRHLTWIAAAAFVSLAACGGIADYGGGGGNGGGNGGGGGGPAGQITVGNDFFRSAHNGTQNAAVDTVTVGTRVTWTWAGGAASHSVRSLGTPNFTSSVIQSGGGKSHGVTFNTTGTYQYDCAVHGAAMRGRLVVLP